MIDLWTIVAALGLAGVVTVGIWWSWNMLHLMKKAKALNEFQLQGIKHRATLFDELQYMDEVLKGDKPNEDKQED